MHVCHACAMHACMPCMCHACMHAMHACMPCMCHLAILSWRRLCAGRPHSGGSQFFMNLNHNANLDWFSSGASKHPVFGQITEGYEIAVEISKVPTAHHMDMCIRTPAAHTIDTHHAHTMYILAHSVWTPSPYCAMHRVHIPCTQHHAVIMLCT